LYLRLIPRLELSVTSASMSLPLILVSPSLVFLELELVSQFLPSPNYLIYQPQKLDDIHFIFLVMTIVTIMIKLISLFPGGQWWGAVGLP
jgi:hypothetical protein